METIIIIGALLAAFAVLGLLEWAHKKNENSKGGFPYSRNRKRPS